MKVNVEIEASAQEMREFLGLPNIQPLQHDLLQALRDNMQKGMVGFDPLSLLRPLFPAQTQSLELLQKSFWDAFNKAETKTEKKAPDETKPAAASKAGAKK
ncbi:MAG: DUF6489 family protein [Gammaproteobacteria bacterium]